MRFCFTLVLMSWFLMTGLVQAADSQVMDQISILQKQVISLQNELSALKSIVNKAPDGTTVINVQQNKQEVILGNSFSNVKGIINLKTNGDEFETVGGNQSLIVDKSKNESIGQNLTQKVQGNSLQTVSKEISIESGKRIIISAGDQLTLRSGNASIVLSKNGEIKMIGTVIDVKGSSDVIIKGTQLQNN